MMMQHNEMFKQMIDFNKSAYENAFKNMNMLQDQIEKVIHLCIDQVVSTPESRKAAKEWASIYRKGFNDSKKLMDDHYRKIGMFVQDKTDQPK